MELLLQLIILAGIVILGVFAYKKISSKFRQGKEAISYTWLNKLHCDQEFCPRPIVNLPIPGDPSNEQFSYENARYCADLVARIEEAYNTPPFIAPIGIEVIEHLTNLDGTPDFGVVLSGGGITWIIFRGTVKPEEWLQDFTYSQQDRPLNIVDKKRDNSQAQLSLQGVSFEEQPKIHSGFLKVYENIKEKMLSAVKKLGNQKIVISGHSLGGAIAIITGLELVFKGYEAVVYAFANPKVGDNKTAEIINAKVPVHSIINMTDIIPTMPPSVSPNFQTPTKPFFYTNCGNIKIFTKNWLSLANNHLLGVYIEALDNKSLS